MTRTLIISIIITNENKIDIKPDLNNTKSTLPPNLQTLKQQLLSGSGFFEYI